MKKLYILLFCLFFAAGAAVCVHADEDTARVIAVSGDVKVVLSGTENEVPCVVAMKLAAGAKVITGRSSYAELAFNKTASNVVRVQERTKVVIKLAKADKIELIDGDIFTLLRDMEPGQEFRVRTPCATCGARGTAWGTRASGKETAVSVVDDKVFVRGINKDGSDMKEKVWVGKGFESRIKKFDRPGKLKKISTSRMRKLRKDLKRVAKPKVVPKKVKEKKVKGVTRKTTVEKKDMTDKSEATPAMTENMKKIRDRQKRTEKLDRVKKRESILERRVERSDNVREQRQETVTERKDDTRIQTLIKSREDGTSTRSP